MDFSLTDEQKELQRLAREFSVKEIQPHAEEHDKTGKFPMEIAKRAFEVGLMNLNIPLEYNGPGLKALDEVIITEELSWGCSGITTAFAVNHLATAPVIIAGSEDQKKKYLSMMTKELTFASYAVTEPQAGSDVSGIQTTAKLIGSEYIINGSKQWITGASVAKWFYVLAKTDMSKGHKGVSAFIVDADTTGIKIGKKEDMMGQRASATHAITFEDVKVPKFNLLGQEGDGFKIAMKAFDYTRPGIAANAVGVARRAMEHAIEYSKTRISFGVPIAMHEGINFLIADMASEIEAARLLTWQAAWAHDNNIRNTKLASFAKRFAADTVMKVTTDAVQILGGYGYSNEYPVSKLMRDAKIFQIYEGTSQIQRLIIAKEIFLR
ncbi:MAG: acyl-CoA dehydrogenase family protein [Candidatus Melainabacteria bacterium]|nr:acyl-CoA dehydrogenase family protein [Candidatus Melainabacteria bacterium]